MWPWQNVTIRTSTATPYGVTMVGNASGENASVVGDASTAAVAGASGRDCGAYCSSTDRNATMNRITPAVMRSAPTEIPHLFSNFAPIVAAANKAITAMTMPWTASWRLNVASRPRVMVANGPRILSGPSVRKRNVNTSPKEKFGIVTPLSGAGGCAVGQYFAYDFSSRISEPSARFNSRLMAA